MIKSLMLGSFQAHKRSEFDFSSGVNVIKGTSNRGKSSVVRAFEWAVLNRPTGFGFRSYFAEKKDDTFVLIELNDSGFVERTRNEKENKYVVGDKENEIEFEALRGAIPEEVTKTLGMTDLNIQGQDDGYFLLQDSPGIVAKKMNEIVGLGVIDVVMKRINSIISTTKTDIANKVNSIYEGEEELTKYNNLDSIEPLISSIEETESLVNSTQSKLHNLQIIDDKIQNKMEAIEEIDQWLEVEDVYKTIKSLADDLTEKKAFLNLLSIIVKKIIVINNTISVSESKVSFGNKINACIVLFNDLETKRAQQEALQNVILRVKRSTEQAVKQDTIYRVQEKQYKEKLKAEGVCPLCNQKIMEDI